MEVSSGYVPLETDNKQRGTKDTRSRCTEVTLAAVQVDQCPS